MPRLAVNAPFLIAASVSLLVGCATPRLHTEAELNSVGGQCGLALGELFQDASEKRLLFLFKIEPSREQRICVIRWARKNHLKAVFVNAINFPEES